MVGSAILRHLKSQGFQNLQLRTSSELDLRNQQAVRDFFSEEKPEYVFLAAAKVGAVSGHAKVGNLRTFVAKCQALEYTCGFNLDRRAYDRCAAYVARVATRGDMEHHVSRFWAEILAGRPNFPKG